MPENDDNFVIELRDVLAVPLRQTVQAVLDSFAGTEIASDHLAAQIEGQVHAWLRLQLQPYEDDE